MEISDENELMQAIIGMEKTILKRVPRARIHGWLLRPYVPAGTEIIAGGIVDPQFGPAVMVGIGTVLKDDPLLNYRGSAKNSIQPIRIIVDSYAKIPIQCSIIKTMKKTRTIIAVTKNAVASKLKKLTNAGAQVLLTQSHNDRINLDDLLNKLGSMGITSVLVEGGGELNASFIESGLVDKLLIFIAPKIIGGAQAVSFVQGKGTAHLRDCYLCEQPKLKRFGEDILLETYPLKSARSTV